MTLYSATFKDTLDLSVFKQGELGEVEFKNDPISVKFIFQGDDDEGLYLVFSDFSDHPSDNPYEIKLTLVAGEEFHKDFIQYINPQFEYSFELYYEDLQKYQEKYSSNLDFQIEIQELDKENCSTLPSERSYMFDYPADRIEKDFKYDFKYADYEFSFLLYLVSYGRVHLSFQLNNAGFSKRLTVVYSLKVAGYHCKSAKMKFNSTTLTCDAEQISKSDWDELKKRATNGQIPFVIAIKRTTESEEIEDEDDFMSLPNDTTSYSGHDNTYSYSNRSYYTPQTNYAVSTVSSKDETGFVGLHNQGATCYLNSLLQTLYTLPAFRKVVYEMPTTGTEDEKKSIPLNLQRLFCQMQLRKEPCSTKELTTSFGWGSTETFMQHDAPEFNRVLLDNLEMKLKGTQLENSIADLFKGQYRKYIRCKNYPYASTHDETFYELQMVVKDCPNLQKSFEKYIEKEILDGDNQYNVESHGKEDAEMGIEFVKFPQVLQLHLTRFTYDFNYDRNVKLNDKFEFPEEIDLSPYLAEDADKSKSYVYQLHDVVVHNGSATFGHYYAFIRPSAEDQWYKFNDSTVSKSTKESAIDDNFGGESETTTYSSSNYYNYWGGGSSGKSYSAYMLMYMRKDAVQNIFEPIPDEAVPEHLKEYMNKKPSETYSSSLDLNSVDITVTTEDDFEEGTLLMKKVFAQKDDPPKLEADNSISTQELYEKIANLLKIDVDEFRLWKQSYYLLPQTLISRSETKKIDFTYSTAQVFVQKKSKEDPVEIPEDDIVVYTKFFFPFDQSNNKVQYIGSFQINRESPLKNLIKMVNEKLGLPEDTELQVYAESIDKKAAILDNALTLDNLSVNMGSVLIFQQNPEKEQILPSKFVKKSISDSQKGEESEVTDHTIPIIFAGDQSVAVTANKYFIMYHEVLEYQFYDVHDCSKCIAILKFPTDILFTDLYKYIANSSLFDYDIDKDSILLYRANYSNEEKPSTDPIDTSYFTTPKTTLYSGQNKRLFFRVIKGTPQKDYANKLCRRIIYSSDLSKIDIDDYFLFDKASDTVGKVVQELVSRGTIPDMEYDIIKMGYYSSMEGFLQLEETCSQYYNTVIRIQPKVADKSKFVFVEVGEFMNSMYYFSPSRNGICYLVDDAKTNEEILDDILAKLQIQNNPKKFRLNFKAKEDPMAKNIQVSQFKDSLKNGASLYIVEKSKNSAKLSASNESIKIYN
ncbi:Clan CA, family C19, ubiquitin hydrolase-like cysteine peptidase [Trichomonas vaginalis G3]|uniref:ubiquitinyl hydrolase 1 n=1 Tax=Trichomonas vaginalis (strain ATCC PRA-98 / G3) TaxID=412133 RepID=A2EM39_TRIV3|nr:ubiquitinyl hydrolase protein [Trichomonas vaginalis G3]EAY06298.1 Clan CA, family C19, ubiquitin hydrolase-like cysteine peptidase [Trichomonas vaginalis G3]KAI5503376.1 ubiquitinyl hydrolase protein [Trichomonas vaginalis G3]|eukprot:XP_001318521.1 Clan CA, family C19, ubiquitin hydrolase-like cysteine peptidase [Trichomonas vaginalis G3]